jgi:hypothetical protein
VDTSRKTTGGTQNYNDDPSPGDDTQLLTTVNVRGINGASAVSPDNDEIEASDYILSENHCRRKRSARQVLKVHDVVLLPE